MPSQDDFARALIEPDRPLPPVIIARGDRFHIYRNNVFASLGAALAKTFPVVEKMLGVEYFSALAQAFARQSLPKSRILAEYGADFPAFINQFPRLPTIPICRTSRGSNGRGLRLFVQPTTSPIGAR